MPRKTPTTIPLVVLFWDGPIARAYLETFKSLNLVPAKLIQLVSNKDLATGQKVGKLLPKVLRLPYAENFHKERMLYWPRRIAKQEKALTDEIFNQVEKNFFFSREALETVIQPKPLSHYAPNTEKLLIHSLRDSVLEVQLADETLPVLYTGGGLVPKKLLQLPCKFIHVHPGYLPYIRGADCLLWSTLMTDVPSASAFYMSPEIDAGDIIVCRWLPKVTFRLRPKKYDLKTLYRALYGFVDPWVRAFVLRELLTQFDQFDALPVTRQAADEGEIFHFMHHRLQKYAIQKMCAGA